MGACDKGKVRLVGESEEDEELARLQSVASDDDEEANEDLSLKIVEKAISMRAAKMASVLRDEDVLEEGVEGGSGGDAAGSSSQGEGVVAVSESKKKGKKGKRKVDSGEGSELSFIALNNEEPSEAVNPAEAVESVDPSPVDTTDNAVMRKLLRGPRYFDPPDSNWGTCYNCGGEGHLAVNCTSQKRKKPCFVCGSLEHGAKQCKKAQNCFICKRSGHHAKKCPEKQKGSSVNCKMCLKCGESGHEMFSCTSGYPPDDLKVVQCYICQEFGHLCCSDPVDPDPSEVSCYKCGELGHTGLACGSAHERTAGEATPASCFRCGEEGHFARECRNSSKAHKSNLNELTNGLSLSCCHRCGEEGHFARECRSSNRLFTLTPIFCENCGEKGHFGHERRCSPKELSSILCYKCGEGGHDAWECRTSTKAHASSSNGPVNGIIASLCYKCGEGGHFARECRKSNKSSGQTPLCKRCGEVGHSAKENKCSAKIMSPKLCYNCGESGHFTRECRNFFKGGKREGKLSTPCLKRDRDNNEPISLPNGDTKSGKRKKSEEPNSRPTTPHVPKHRGGWITKDPGDFSSGRDEKMWESPSTKDRKARSNSAPKSPGSGKAFWHSSRFRDIRNGIPRRNYGQW